MTCYPSATASRNASVAIRNGSIWVAEIFETYKDLNCYSPECVLAVDDGSYSALQLPLGQLFLDKMLVNVWNDPFSQAFAFIGDV